MPLQPEHSHNLSAFDIVIMCLPVLAALATAILSLWRESNEIRRDSLAVEKRAMGSRAWLGLSGWTLIALAVTTCVTGLYSGVKDLRDTTARSEENATLREELAETKVTLSTQLTQARKETIDAENATLDATKALGDALMKNADAHASELHKQQDLTLNSVLSSLSEPAYAIFELDLLHPILLDRQIGTRSNVAQLMAQAHDDNWRYSFLFEPIFGFIKWGDPVPMNIDAYIGSWPMHNETGDQRQWGAAVAVIDRTKPNNLPLAGSMEVRESRHLIIRFPKLDSQSMIDLWRGPTKNSLQMDIWVQLNNVDDEGSRKKIESMAKSALAKVTAYYTISAKAGLCKKAELNFYNVHAAPNQLRVRYIGTNQIDTVACPDYVASPQGLD
jgi:hypothetical protein